MKKVILLMMLATGVVQADQMTATKSGCMGCHHLQNKLIGPSIKDIAAKHKGGDVQALVAVVKAGKSGDQLTWGGKIPMPPSQAPEADVKKVVEWMLTH